MDGEIAEKYVGMMPDEFDAERWREDLSEIADEFSKQSGILFEEQKDPFRLIRAWKDKGESQQLVVENKRVKRDGQKYPEERVTVWTLSGMSFNDLKNGKPIPQSANLWGICLPFAPDEAQRKEILTMVEANVANLKKE
jgi:hypothetical protein